MSVRVMRWALRLQTPISHAAARVLMVLAEHAGDDGCNAYPSLETISEVAQADRRTVMRSLDALETAGVITRQKGGGRTRSTIYDLQINLASGTGNRGNTPPSAQKKTGAEMSNNGGVAPLNTPEETGAEMSETGAFLQETGAEMLENRGVVPPEPVLNLSLKEERKRTPLAPLAAAAPVAPAKPSPAAANERGTRLPDDWEPNAKEAAYAEKLGLQVHRVADDFRCYWLAKPGKAGRWSRWDLVWMKWCRTEADRQQTRTTRLLPRETHSQQRRRELGLPSLSDYRREQGDRAEAPRLRLVP